MCTLRTVGLWSDYGLVLTMCFADRRSSPFKDGRHEHRSIPLQIHPLPRTLPHHLYPYTYVIPAIPRLLARAPGVLKALTVLQVRHRRLSRSISLLGLLHGLQWELGMSRVPSGLLRHQRVRFGEPRN